MRAAEPGTSSVKRRPYGEADLVGAETQRHRADHPRNGRDVIELLDDALDHQAVLDVACREVHDRQVAERTRAFARQSLMEGESLEGAVLARARHADHRVIAEKGQPASEALQEAHRLEAAGAELDVAELAGARLHEPEPALMQPRRVRHRETPGHGRAARDVEDDPAAPAMRAPSLGEVAPGDAGDERGMALAHGDPVQVAAVLGRQPVDEGGAPHWPEAGMLGQRGQAVETGHHEDGPSILAGGDVVDVDVAGCVPAHRHVEGVVALPCLPGLEEVLEAPELVERGQPERASGSRAEPHRARKRPLVDREPAIGPEADQEELAGLVGGEGEARLRAGEPGGEQPRSGQLEPGLVRHAPPPLRTTRIQKETPPAGKPLGAAGPAGRSASGRSPVRKRMERVMGAILEFSLRLT